jgi:riboflavin synthase
MFTGIIQDIGHVQAIERRGEDLRLAVATERLDLAQSRIGDSMAVAGVCLTVVELSAHRFSADISRETLARTTIGEWCAGRAVNLEAALRAGDPLGGHLVAGHIDGGAQLLERRGDARSEQMRFRVPGELARYLARKGSVCVDGVSLTVNGVQNDDSFDVNLVPHTLAVTTLGTLQVGERVNLEVDLLARYVERLVANAARE